MRRGVLLGPAALLLSMVIPVPARATTPTYTGHDLGTLGGAWSQAVAVNGQRVVAGNSTTSDGARHAFVWVSGRMTDLGTLGGDWSEAVAVTAAGDVVGNSRTDSGAVHGFLWRGGSLLDLGTLGGPTSEVTAANGGYIVGSSETSQGDTHAFLWSAGRMRDLGTLGGNCSEALGVNSRGQVTGVAGTAIPLEANLCGERHPFLWAKGVIRDLEIPFTPPDDPYFNPQWRVTINDQGTIAGAYIQFGDSGSQASMARLFKWTPGGVRFAGPLVLNSFLSVSENSRGDVAGVRYIADAHYQGYVWVGDTLTYLQTSTGRTWAVGISGSGIVAAYDYDHDPEGNPTGCAFVWNSGVRTNLGRPGDGSSAAGINAAGDVIGATQAADFTSHATLWTRG